MKPRKWSKAAALLAVMTIGGFTPAANVIIPSIQSVAHAEVQSTGTFGSCEYDIEDGVLTIHEGTLGDGSLYEAFAKKYYVTKVVIEDGVVANAKSNGLFYKLSYLTEIDGLKNLDTSNMTDMSFMFFYCCNLQHVDVSKFNTKKVKSMSCMFMDCWHLDKIDVSMFDTSQVTDMSAMFDYCCYATEINVSGINTSEVKSMECMFADCWYTQLDVSSFKTEKVTNMNLMFYYCFSATQLDVSRFNTALVTNMNCMFMLCYDLTQLDLRHFDTSSVTSMDYMFNSNGLTTLDLSTFDTANVTTMNGMFAGSTQLWQLTLGEHFTMASNTGLLDPVVGTVFDQDYHVTSTNWQAVGTGTAHAPNGAQVTSMDLPAKHNASGQVETYVWTQEQGMVKINYLDSSNANKPITSEQLTGVALTNYTVSAEELNALIAKGYELDHADAGYPAGTFDNTTQNINVYLKHGVDKSPVQKSVKQTVKYEYADGTKASADSVQTITFNGEQPIDRVNGNHLPVAWNNSPQMTKAVDSPNVDGYYASRTIVAAQSVVATDGDYTVVVKYLANPATPVNPTPPATGQPTSGVISGPNATVVTGLANATQWSYVGDGLAAANVAEPTPEQQVISDSIDNNETDDDVVKKVSAADRQVGDSNVFPMWLISIMIATVVALATGVMMRIRKDKRLNK